MYIPFPVDCRYLVFIMQLGFALVSERSVLLRLDASECL